MIKDILILWVCGTLIVATPASGEQKEFFDLQREEVSVVKSLVDSSTISEIVKRYYSVEAPVSSKVLSTGVNDMYLVEAGREKFVLRLSRKEKYTTMNPSEFYFELEWLNYLYARHIPVSYPLPRNDGMLCCLIEAPEGPRYATLFSFAEGSEDMDEERAFLLGQALAELHAVSETFSTEYDRFSLDAEELIDSSLTGIKEYFVKEWKEEIAQLELLARNAKEKIIAIEKTNETYGIIAGDVHGGNQHFTSDNQLTMFDFEFCAYGYRAYDIATFRWSRGTEEESLWEAFLKGYQSKRKLQQNELEAIDAFVVARHLWWMKFLTELPEYQHYYTKEFWKSAFSSLLEGKTHETNRRREKEMFWWRIRKGILCQIP